MKTSKTIKEVQKLNGNIVALNRFLAKSNDKCKPFYDLLKLAKNNVKWNDSCEEAFNRIKGILTQLPTLHSPIEGETLMMYIVSYPVVVCAVLLSKATEQQPIYYYSKDLQEVEKRYPQIEKLTLAVVLATKRLRPYFQAHQIQIPTNYTLSLTLHKPSILGRLTKRAIELKEHDIKYVPTTTIKAQPLANFIVDLTPSKASGTSIS